jgi:single-strand DNA-binding protein
MASLNKVYIIGNLTKDPDLKFLQSGQAVANLRLATNRKWKASSGEAKEEVTYVSVEVWGKSAEACGEYLKKGSPLLVEGRLKLKEWTAQDGQKRSVLEVVAERVQFLSNGQRQGGSPKSSESSEEDTGPLDEGKKYEDDLPF